MDIKLDANVKGVAAIKRNVIVVNQKEEESSTSSTTSSSNNQPVAFTNDNNVVNTNNLNKTSNAQKQKKSEDDLIEDFNEKAQRERELEAERRAEESEQRAKEAMKALNLRNLALRFENSKNFEDSQVINVIDVNSDEVIRQIPSDEFLRVAHAINEFYEHKLQEKMEKEPSLYNEDNISNQFNNQKRGTLLDFEA